MHTGEPCRKRGHEGCGDVLHKSTKKIPIELLMGRNYASLSFSYVKHAQGRIQRLKKGGAYI